MKRAFRGLILSVLLSIAIFGQTSASGLQFEVASVKAVPGWPPPAGVTRERGSGGGCLTSLKIDRSRVEIRCATLPMLIGYAYRFSPDRITGPDWMKTVGATRFDIAAKIPQSASTNQVPEMLQSLLADRFKLVIHRGSANREIYALVAAKGGIRMKPSGPHTDNPPQAEESADGTGSFYGAAQERTVQNSDGSESATISNPRMGTVRQTGAAYRSRWEASSISAGGLADLIDKAVPLPSPVIDRTGLGGRYQMVLEVDLSPVRPANAAAGSDQAADFETNVLRAFNDGLGKLGLRLERSKGPIETIVVDRVEKTPTEN